MHALLRVCAVIALASSCAAPAKQTCAERATTDDEDAIITAVVQRSVLDGSSEIEVRSETTTSADFETFLDFSGLRKKQGVSADAVDDLVARNAKSRALGVADLRGLSVTPVFVTPDRLPKQSNGVPPVVSPSRPGFGCDEAIIYVEQDCGDLCDSGAFLSFQRDSDGVWQLVTELAHWIS